MSPLEQFEILPIFQIPFVFTNASLILILGLYFFKKKLFIIRLINNSVVFYSSFFIFLIIINIYSNPVYCYTDPFFNHNILNQDIHTRCSRYLISNKIHLNYLINNLYTQDGLVSYSLYDQIKIEQSCEILIRIHEIIEPYARTPRIGELSLNPAIDIDVLRQDFSRSLNLLDQTRPDILSSYRITRQTPVDFSNVEKLKKTTQFLQYYIFSS